MSLAEVAATGALWRPGKQKVLSPVSWECSGLFLDICAFKGSDYCKYFITLGKVCQPFCISGGIL